MEVPEGEPTPAEIREMCEQIRSEWKGIKSNDARRQEMIPWTIMTAKTPKDL
tara:strand:+ start:193 stop:348 length:156 start_codon:yes stop_codon:yes gene_type:complete